MKKYKFSIEETLKREIIVNAENSDEALHIVEQLYQNEEIVLDSTDFILYKIEHIDSKLL